MTPLDTLLKSLNTRRAERVFSRLPETRFVDLARFKSFRLKADMPVFILFKYRPALRGADLTVDTSKSADLTMGKMHYLYSGAILFGYLFEFPVQPYQIYENFVAVNASDFDSATVRDVGPLVQNRDLTVYACSDTSIVMVANQIHYIDVKR